MYFKRHFLALTAIISIALGQTCPAVAITTAFADVSVPYQSVNHPMSLTSTWGSISGAKPTNQFWTNLILPNNNNKVVVPLPYMTTFTTTGVNVGLPGRQSTASGVMATYVPNTWLGANEAVNDFTLTSFDALSVTTQWKESSGSGSYSVPLVRGSPYITAQYNNLTPLFKTIHALLTVNGQGKTNTVTGSKFVLTFNNGQTWVLYVTGGQTITFNWGSNQLTANSRFTGNIRMAIVPNDAQSVLDNYSETIPTGVSLNFYNGTSNENAGYVEFVFKTTGGSSSNLLILALPHHMDVLSSGNNQVLANKYQTIKGWMTGLVGNTWRLRYAFTDIVWTAPRSIPSGYTAQIITALNKDAGSRGQTLDPYWGGKSFGKMARLALIADELGQTSTRDNIVNNMISDIAPWFSATNTDPLRYDSTYGGIVSQNGIRDAGADYGNGYYNDHHFHYGYFMYATAVIAKFKPSWWTDNKDKVLPLVRDIASPITDSRFPQARHKDWYDGHSWASGLFSFGDAKNQESSSECAAAYYGVYLLGQATSDPQLTFFGKMLLATETISIKKYWQIKSDTQIYDAAFAANHVAGVLWASKVDYATFFGLNVEFIHGIQYMPFTPYSEDLLGADWLQEDYPVVSSAFSRSSPVLTDDWKGFLYMAHAVISPNSAWNEVQGLKAWDSGNSQANILHWVVTRPGFNANKRGEL